MNLVSSLFFYFEMTELKELLVMFLTRFKNIDYPVLGTFRLNLNTFLQIKLKKRQQKYTKNLVHYNYNCK